MSRCVASAQLGLSSALVGPVPARPTRLHTGSSAIWLGKVGILNILWRLPTDAVWVRFCDTGSSGEWGPEVGRKRGRDWGIVLAFKVLLTGAQTSVSVLSIPKGRTKKGEMREYEGN